MVKKNDSDKTICVDLNKEELKIFAKVKKKFGTRTNAETLRSAIKRAMEELP